MKKIFHANLDFNVYFYSATWPK